MKKTDSQPKLWIKGGARRSLQIFTPLLATNSLFGKGIIVVFQTGFRCICQFLLRKFSWSFPSSKLILAVSLSHEKTIYFCRYNNSHEKTCYIKQGYNHILRVQFFRAARNNSVDRVQAHSPQSCFEFTMHRMQDPKYEILYFIQSFLVFQRSCG